MLNVSSGIFSAVCTQTFCIQNSLPRQREAKAHLGSRASSLRKLQGSTRLFAVRYPIRLLRHLITPGYQPLFTASASASFFACTCVSLCVGYSLPSLPPWPCDCHFSSFFYIYIERAAMYLPVNGELTARTTDGSGAGPSSVPTGLWVSLSFFFFSRRQ